MDATEIENILKSNAFIEPLELAYSQVFFPPLISGYSTKGSLFKFLGINGFKLSVLAIFSMTGHLSVIYTLAIATQSYRLRLTQHSSFSRSAFEWLERPGNTSSFLNCSAFLNFLFCLTIFTDFNFYTVDVHSIPAFTVLIEKHPDFVAISMNKNYYYFGALYVQHA
ncbi:hypothetical protein M3Y97_01136900 [Aphelenchoides bicaudatus]|nr:hypothetical protein M3Y97_01136900 [Aphelenchoides bicaudatus]